MSLRGVRNARGVVFGVISATVPGGSSIGVTESGAGPVTRDMGKYRIRSLPMYTREGGWEIFLNQTIFACSRFKPHALNLKIQRRSW